MLGVVLVSFLALQSPAGQLHAQDESMAPPPAEQVLAIPDALRDEFKENVMGIRSPEQRMYKLADFMLKPSGLGLTYEAYATRTVSESYQARKVNCMAFTLMAVALAREAGLTAYAQQIDRVMAWDVTGDVVAQNLHANAVVVIGERKFMLDIAADRLAAPVVDYQIDDAHLLALFYGNRAMELLIDGKLAQAQVWQSQALRYAPEDATLWSNAGILLQQQGDLTGAERMFLTAVEKNPRLSSAYSNIVALYQAEGKLVAAERWQKRAKRMLSRDPYYQFGQGRRLEQAGDLQAAIAYYRRAVALYRQEHLFHFFLARAYYQAGQLQQASVELDAAKRLSKGGDQLRYQSKIDALQRLRH